ncbi:negative elongation factor A-like [Oppia nitens]|uniref:negative elongation factor A-like n=1 Tax=Oppia nitens TaxID=1686743 RepID=UPI0023DC4B60|nr:negative elongation factor A-like [Oppia nitens]
MANKSFMSNLSNSDTSLWLHNKLGTSNDLWSDTTSIVGQLSGDVLRNIRDCFVDLQSQVKLKLLLSFLHISRRNVEQWRTELEEILELAVNDSDQWVSIIAELLQSYPQNGTINFQLNTNSSSFNDLIVELKKLVRKHGDKGILPMECLYMNKSALTAAAGQLAQPVKHFALKRKPKSATLRAELLQKSNDAAIGRRNSTGPSVPIRCRGLSSDTTPLKGIPTRNELLHSRVNSFKTPTNSLKPSFNNRRPVGSTKTGIKLLDITEQPLGSSNKRRKKAQNEENENKQKDNEKTETEPITPDYAAGLTSIVPPSPAPPSYAPPATPAPQPTVIPNENYQQIQTSAPIPQQIPTVQQRFVNQNIDNNVVKQVKQSPQIKTTSSLTPTPNTPQLSHIVSTPQVIQQLPPQQLQQQQQPPPQQQMHNQMHAQQIQIMQTSSIPQQVQQQQQQVIIPVQQQQMQQQQQQSGQPQQPFVRRQLQLSREQMLAAQEMFSTANKVTRPEKALILGFMAGSRENPCPQLGNVVTIKLSEKEEDVRHPDGTIEHMIVETHFQMNYNTGEWKKVQKCRKLDQNVQNTHTIQGYQTLQQTV